VFEFTEGRARAAAARDFAAAKTEDDYRRVIQAHSGSVVAANARLMLADQLRAAGKLDEAAATLREFIDKNANHPLIAGAWTSLGFTQQDQGKNDEALNTFQRVAATYPTSFAAPVALLAQARLYKVRGEMDQAKRLYEQVVSQFGQTNFAREALMETQRLPKKSEPPATAGAPATTPGSNAAPNPAPSPGETQTPSKNSAAPAGEAAPAPINPAPPPPPAPSAPSSTGNEPAPTTPAVK
jgi:tetratricopeptide (TPR) repeat protein